LYAYDNPCYAPAVAGVSTCTFRGGGRTLSFDQNGGKRAQAMLAVDAVFHFQPFMDCAGSPRRPPAPIVTRLGLHHFFTAN
jgi:hypothetical protein